MVHFGEVFENLKLAVKQCYQTGQFNRTKIGGKCQNSNATFWVIFKQCDAQFKGGNHKTKKYGLDLQWNRMLTMLQGLHFTNIPVAFSRKNIRSWNWKGRNCLEISCFTSRRLINKILWRLQLQSIS